MPNAIQEKVSLSSTDNASKSYSAIGTGQLAIKRCWTDNEKIRRSFSLEFVQQHAENMMAEIVKISTSANPRMANRERLSYYVHQAARLQVLIIDSPPAQDDTELRGQVGVTGELKARLCDLYLSNDSFKEFFLEAGITPKTWTDMWTPVWSAYKQMFAYMQIFQLVRLAFDDVGREPGADWYRPYWVATCGLWECRYRVSLGMNSPLSDKCLFSSMVPVLLNIFDNCVLGGVQHPDQAWEELIEGFEAGNVAWRANSWLRPPAVPLAIAEMRRKHYRPDALSFQPLGAK
jgi:hypothetical protein